LGGNPDIGYQYTLLQPAAAAAAGEDDDVESVIGAVSILIAIGVGTICYMYMYISSIVHLLQQN
jgi:hypothetical protein